VLEPARPNDERSDTDMDSIVGKDAGVDVRIAIELVTELDTKLKLSEEDVPMIGVAVESSEDGNGVEKEELNREDAVEAKAVLEDVVETSEPVEPEATTVGTAGVCELLDAGKLDRLVEEAEEEDMDGIVRIDEDDRDSIDIEDELRLEEDLDELSLQRPNAD